MDNTDSSVGYTPVPDTLVNLYDHTTAYIWGLIWRYCQMEEGICRAAHETIAKRAGVSRRNVFSRISKLVADGYIEDLTPELSNKPHTYCTKKGAEKLNFTVQNLHSKNNQSANSAQQNSGTVQILHSHYANSAQQSGSTVQNLHSKNLDSSSTTTTNILDEIGSLCSEYFFNPKDDPYKTDLINTIKTYTADKVLWAIKLALSPERANGKPKTWAYVVGILSRDRQKAVNQNSLIASAKNPMPPTSPKSPPLAGVDMNLLQTLQQQTKGA